MTKKNKSMNNRYLHKYDEEWIDLILIAKDYGFSVTEIRDFLNKEKITGLCS